MGFDTDEITRRSFLGTSAALAAGLLMGPEALAASAHEIQRLGSAAPAGKSRQLVYLDSDTPPTFDLDQTGTGLTEQIANACYGGDIVRYKIVRDAHAGILRASIFSPGDTGINSGLAERIDVSHDHRVYTVHLRRDVKSALGNPLTAEDVIWSFKRSMALNQTGGFFANVMEVTKADMKALDAHTVRFTLPKPNPIFLRVDAMKYYGGLFDAKAAKAHATKKDPWAKAYLATHTAGFDAYTVQSYRKGQEVVLTANPHWYRGRPHFDHVVWKAVPESANRLSLLLRGGADIAAKLTPPQLKAAQHASGITVTSYVANQIKSIQLNLRRSTLKDPRVRQAIAYAIPYNQILSGVYFGTGRLVKSPIPEIYPGYTPDFWHYSTNIDKARRLMKAAHRGPFTMTLTYDVSTYDDPLLAPIIKSALKDIGITVNLNGVPNAVFVDRLFKHKDDAYLEYNWPFIAHPAYALWVYWRSNSFLNIGGWKSHEFDSLVDRMLVETNQARLNKMARRAQQIWEAQQPWILIANPGWHVAHRSSITNFAWFSDNDIRFQELSGK